MLRPAASLLLFLATLAPAADLVIDFSQNRTPESLGGRGAGQSFYPADAGGVLASYPLTAFSLWKGNLGGPGSPTTYLAIYDRDPDEVDAVLVGTSTNSLDTTPTGRIAVYTEMEWTFDRLPLQPEVEYWAVLSSSAMDVNPDTTVELSLQHSSRNSSIYRGDAIIRDRTRHELNADLRFTATFCDPAAPLTGPRLTVVGFEPLTGDLLFRATGLDPAKSYDLKRATPQELASDPPSFPTLIDFNTGGDLTFDFFDTFDGNPATRPPEAYYRLEEAPGQ